MSRWILVVEDEPSLGEMICDNLHSQGHGTELIANGSLASERIERGGIVSDDLLTIGRVAVDAEVGIDLVHVPTAERFAPLWPVAGHGALATLLLLSGTVGRAVASVRAVAEVLGALPRARIFHLLLLEKGERVSPEDLRQNLSIVDDGSLFLIPLESPEKAGVLLREMFGRILP